MLTKIKVPIHDLMTLMPALDESILDVDQVKNLIKFCPTKEEMELLQGYKGDKESLEKCEQVADLRINLNTINSVAEEIRRSVNLKRIMQTILSLGNALNQGTARGSAIGFRLDSLLKLCDIRARNNKMTLMHYLCKKLKRFLVVAEAKVRSLTSLYTVVTRNADALAQYFGEDPARCLFEQVVSALLDFTSMFERAHTENSKQLELERKRAQREAEQEKKLAMHKKD